MPKRRCARCPQLVEATVYRGLCDRCRKQREAARGSRTDRGYGADHQALRADWQRRIDSGETVLCWRPSCRGVIDQETPWHLGHDDRDRSIIRGPEHDHCNLRAAGLNSHTTPT